MPLITKADAELAIQPFITDFVRIMQSAWEDWMISPIAPNMQHKRVRSMYVWNQMMTHAKSRLDGQDGIRVETLAPWDGVLVGTDIFLRLKKADENLLSRNYPTPSALAFLDQTQDMFGGVARLELVYSLDASETQIDRIVVLQRHKNFIAWHIDLLGNASEGQNIIPLTTPPAETNEQPVAKRIIKPKRDVSDDDKDVSAG